MVKSALEVISKEQIAVLRESGFVVIHRRPTKNMAKAFYANEYPEDMSFEDGFHRMIAQSIREQNEGG